RTAIRRVFPDPAGANDSYGFDLAGNNRGPSIAANELWACDRLSVRLEHLGRRGWCTAWRDVSHRSIWTSRDWISCRFGGLSCRRDRVVSGEVQRGNVAAVQISAALGCKLSATVASACR